MFGVLEKAVLGLWADVSIGSWVAGADGSAWQAG